MHLVGYFHSHITMHGFMNVKVSSISGKVLIWEASWSN